MRVVERQKGMNRTHARFFFVVGGHDERDRRRAPGQNRLMHAERLHAPRVPAELQEGSDRRDEVVGVQQHEVDEDDDVEDVKEDEVEEEEPGSAPELVGWELPVIPSIASSSSGITITVEGAHQACLSCGYVCEKLCSVRTASTSLAWITK